MSVREHMVSIFDKKLNIEKVISKKELADIAGVEPSAVTKWIRGTSAPNIESIPDICNALGITILELFGVDGINELSAEDKMLLDKIKNNPALYEVVKNYNV